MTAWVLEKPFLRKAVLRSTRPLLSPLACYNQLRIYPWFTRTQILKPLGVGFDGMFIISSAWPMNLLIVSLIVRWAFSE